MIAMGGADHGAGHPATTGQGTQQPLGRVQAPLGVKRELLSSIGLFIGTGLLGFWFGVGAALGATMVNSLEELIDIK